MKRWRWLALALLLLSLLAALNRPSGGGPDLAVEQALMSRAAVSQQGAVTVRAAVLTDDESKAISARRWPIMVSRLSG